MTRSVSAVGLVSMALASCSASRSAPPASGPSASPGPAAAPAEVDTSEEAGVERTIAVVFGGVDAHRWHDVEAAMTESIDVDYSDLGGPKGAQPAKDLVAGWASFLPGFDATAHHVHEVAIWVAGDRASATFEAIAVHLKHEENGTSLWTVFAGYDAEFEKVEGEWKLARLALSLRDQSGDKELPGRIASAGSDGTDSSHVGQTDPHPAVEGFFSALENRDRAALSSVLSEAVVQEMPLAPAGFPKAVEGRDQLLSLFDNVLSSPQRYDRTYLATGRDDALLVRFEGAVDVEGGTYENGYVNLFEIDSQGKIARIVEHFNPHILLERWPGLELPHHSKHAAGASTKDVEVREVRFERDGTELVGHLFLPQDFDPAKSYPAAVVAGSWTSVKEQMPDTYASRLAAEGIVSLTFDFGGFGQSGGTPRQMEDPSRKIADIEAAIAFLKQQPGVDSNAVGGVGICAGAGYVAHAAAKKDPGVSKVMLIAPWLHDEAMARAVYEGRPGGADALIAAGDAANQAYATSGEMDYVLATSELDPLSAMFVPGDVFDYYLNPAKGAGPHYENRFAVGSWGPWIQFDAIAAAKNIQVPVSIVHSENGAIPDGAKRFHQALHADKDILWLNDFGQEDFYHRAEAVDAAIDVAKSFLR